MKFPNKVRNFKQSTLYIALKILEHTEYKEIGVVELFLLLEKEVDIIEYKDALCLLYLIDKIDINFEKERILYA